MNKLLKGAVAGAAGIALLLGGAGTFAAWNASTSLGTDASNITTGDLYLSSDPTSGTWAYANGDEVTRIVPGDVVNYSQTVTVHGSGDHLHANFQVNLGQKLTQTGGTHQDGAFTVSEPVATVAADSGLTAVAGTTNQFTVDPAALPKDGAVVTVTVSVTFNDIKTGTGNGTNDQDETLTLPSGAVTLTQS